MMPSKRILHQKLTVKPFSIHLFWNITMNVEQNIHILYALRTLSKYKDDSISQEYSNYLWNGMKWKREFVNSIWTEWMFSFNNPLVSISTATPFKPKKYHANSSLLQINK